MKSDLSTLTWQCVGTIAETSPGYTKAILSTEEGRATVSTGEYVILDCGEIGLYGQVIAVQMESKAAADSFNITARIQLFVTVRYSDGRISPGVEQQPAVGGMIYLAPQTIVHAVAESRRGRGDEDLTISVARLVQDRANALHFTPEMVFGRHCAILGASGGGKSWTIARLLEEVANYSCKVILLDATGEFGTFTKGAAHVHIGNNPSPRAGSKEVALPYWHLTENDLFAIFKPTGQGQAPKLRAAIKTLKLIRLTPDLGLDGLFIKANKSKVHFEAEYLKYITKLEDPKAAFDISKLIRQIQNECVNPNRSSTELNYWGDYNGVEQSLVVPLINRISDILNSENLNPIFNPGSNPSLIEVVDKFLAHPSGKVLVVSLEFLSFAYSAREIVANALGRYLLKLAREEKFVKNPLLVVLDEAHQFLNEDVETKMGGYALDAFALVAKEGRKYSLTCCLSTQRPRDIPESVLSQMGTFIVHRLTNDSDRNVIERGCAEADKSSLGQIPALAPGQAIVPGIDFPVPLSIVIEEPNERPDSHGPEYQKYWKPLR